MKGVDNLFIYSIYVVLLCRNIGCRAVDVVPMKRANEVRWRIVWLFTECTPYIVDRIGR